MTNQQAEFLLRLRDGRPLGLATADRKFIPAEYGYRPLYNSKVEREVDEALRDLSRRVQGLRGWRAEPKTMDEILRAQSKVRVLRPVKKEPKP